MQNFLDGQEQRHMNRVALITRLDQYLDALRNMRNHPHHHIEGRGIDRLFYYNRVELVNGRMNEVPERRKRRKIKIRKSKDCPICMNKIKKNNYVYKLRCKHHFHQKCLKRWEMQRSNCPTCRANLQ